MVILSKEIFYRNINKETPCSMLHLWSSSCIDGVSVVAKNVFIGSMKFFGPIYLLKLFLSKKRSKKEILLQQFLAYMRTVGFGVTYSVLLFGSFCVFTNLKMINYYHAFRSGVVAGLSILTESEENKFLNSLLFFNQVLEGAINVFTKGQTKKLSRWKTTTVFMGISAVLMYLSKIESASFLHLWFYRTKSFFKNYDDDKTPCKHKNSCFHYALQGAFEYFCIGYLIDLVKYMLPRLGRCVTSPNSILSFLISRRYALFGLFFGSYALLYRAITCYLIKKDGRDYEIHSLIAGFIAGCTYCIKPNIQILIIGITTILQFIWQRLRRKYKLPDNIPYGLFVFSLSNGILLHLYFTMEDYCPSYTSNMLNVTTNNLVIKIYSDFWWLLKQSDVLLKHSNNLKA